MAQACPAYADFLGTELSLAYAQRLLIVMPNGFGFNWQRHSANAPAYQVLDRLHIGPGGDRSGLRRPDRGAAALAQASGIRLAAPASGSVAGSANGGTAQGTTAQGTQSGGQPAATTVLSGSQVPLIAGIAPLAAVIVVAAGCLLAPLPRRGPAAEALASTAEALLPIGVPAGTAAATPLRIPGYLASRGGSWAWRSSLLPCTR